MYIEREDPICCCSRTENDPPREDRFHNEELLPKRTYALTDSPLPICAKSKIVKQDPTLMKVRTLKQEPR